MNFSRLRAQLSRFRTQPWHTVNAAISSFRPRLKSVIVGVRSPTLLLQILNFGCALHLFQNYIGKPTLTTGVSMLPTLANEHEWVLENRLTCLLFPGRFSRGDLVIVQSPTEPNHLICKRIIGLPGDVICVDPLGQTVSSNEHVVIPQGHVWISGDNMSNSKDSRYYGPVPMALIRSRVVMSMIIWPPKFTLYRNQANMVE